MNGRLVLGLAAALAVTACVPTARLDDWLLCGDCLEGERERAAEVGSQGVPYLGLALRGFSPVQEENLRRQFRQSYRAIYQYRGGPPPAPSETAYVERLLSNADATYRIRAATALADMSVRSRTAAALARPFLQVVLRDHASGAEPLREDVARSVEAALAAASYAPFSGTLSDTSVSFLDTVTVLKAGGSPAWDPTTVDVALAGAPFPDALRTGRWPDSIRFVAVGRPGPYALVLSGAGAGGRPERATLTITSLPYAPHDTVGAPSVSVVPDGAQRFLVLRRSDPPDHFRMGLSDTTSVALRVEWRAFEAVGTVGAGASSSADVDVLRCGVGDPLPADPSPPGDFPRSIRMRDSIGPQIPGIAAVQRKWRLAPGCWLARVRGNDLNAIARLLVRAVP